MDKGELQDKVMMLRFHHNQVAEAFMRAIHEAFGPVTLTEQEVTDLEEVYIPFDDDTARDFLEYGDKPVTKAGIAGMWEERYTRIKRLRPTLLRLLGHSEDDFCWLLSDLPTKGPVEAIDIYLLTVFRLRLNY